ncbi:MAG: tail fiber domain-containing protein [Bacteroidia bacterium]|nr:tail fiber domain-containing protein [Bacteroidia bacterium]
MHLTSYALGNTTRAYGIAVTAGSNGAPLSVGIKSEASGAGAGGINYGAIFLAQGNNPFPSAQNIGLVAIAENVASNANGISTSVGPSNAPVLANSVHKGIDIVVSTGNNSSAIQNLTQYGIKSDVRNLGIVSGASSEGKLYGVYSRAWNESQQGPGGFMNFGVYATAETSKIIDGAAGTESNIAIYATTKQLNYNTQTVGRNSWAGWFDGDVYIGGSGGVGGGASEVLVINGAGRSSMPMWTVSDSRYKNNIKKLDDIQSKIKKLSGYTYTLKAKEFKDKNFTEAEQIGFIAQELQEVFPQLVSEDKNGYLAVNYQGMVPVLLEAAKAQQEQIDSQKTALEKQQQQIDELKALVQSLAGADGSKTPGNSTSTSINLSDKNVLVLDQNVPNPFAESTVITYNIPNEFTKAQIIFTTNDGKVIKSIDITEKGAGSVNIFANDLTHGMYSYSLIIDGKTIDTKKMIKE